VDITKDCILSESDSKNGNIGRGIHETFYHEIIIILLFTRNVFWAATPKSTQIMKLIIQCQKKCQEVLSTVYDWLLSTQVGKPKVCH